MSEFDEQDVIEDVEEVQKEEKPKPKTSKSKSKVKALRVSGIQREHVMFRGELDGEMYYRLVPVEVWQGDGEQEFDKDEFLGYDRPVWAKR